MTSLDISKLRNSRAHFPFFNFTDRPMLFPPPTGKYVEVFPSSGPPRRFLLNIGSLAIHEADFIDGTCIFIVNQCTISQD